MCATFPLTELWYTSLEFPPSVNTSTPELLGLLDLLKVLKCVPLPSAASGQKCCFFFPDAVSSCKPLDW